MELKSFRVWNYRSINDSGDIDVSRITSIVGRNESGKSNLLRALRSLNPAEGFAELNSIKDFPRHRRLEECTPETKVLSTTWLLSSDDREELSEILPRAKDVTHVVVGRYYKKQRWVSLGDLKDIQFDAKEVVGAIRKIVPAVKAAAEKKEDSVCRALTEAADAFETAISAQPGLTKEKWAENAKKALPKLRQALATADVELTDTQDQHVVKLEELSDEISQDNEAQGNRAVNQNRSRWVNKRSQGRLRGLRRILLRSQSLRQKLPTIRIGRISDRIKLVRPLPRKNRQYSRESRRGCIGVKRLLEIYY